MASLIDRLLELGYEGLFLRLGNEELEALWREPGVSSQLLALAGDGGSPVPARFLAAEILFRKLPGFPEDPMKSPLAAVYATALRETELANPWSLPGELDGPVGRHLVALGDDAIKPLRKLLTDDRQIWYSGSQEATYGNSFHWRVKDFAAFFISTIRGLPFVAHQDPAARDRDIAVLQSHLSTSN